MLGSKAIQAVALPLQRSQIVKAGRLDSLFPVSYTHLDVYKRQPLQSAGIVPHLHFQISASSIKAPFPAGKAENRGPHAPCGLPAAFP